MNPLISVIIPVYNIEKYLERCIKSVLSQTLKSFEIIIIDDGSTDNTSKIINIYKEYKNIEVISTANKGVSAARNLGIGKSQGDYIYFLDADDYIEKNTLLKLFDTATLNKTPVVIGGYFTQSNNLIITNNERHTIVSDSLVTITKILKNELPRTACGILFERSVVEKKRILFSEDLKYGEDFLFTLEFLSYCNLISIVYDVTYIIEARNDSASRQNSINHIENLKKVNNILMKFKKEKNLERIDNAFRYYIATEIILSVEKILNAEEEYEKKIDSIRKTKNYKSYSEISNKHFKENFKTMKLKIKIILLKLIPARVFLKTYAIIKRKNL